MILSCCVKFNMVGYCCLIIEDIHCLSINQNLLTEIAPNKRPQLNISMTTFKRFTSSVRIHGFMRPSALLLLFMRFMDSNKTYRKLSGLSFFSVMVKHCEMYGYLQQFDIFIEIITLKHVFEKKVF